MEGTEGASPQNKAYILRIISSVMLADSLAYAAMIYFLRKVPLQNNLVPASLSGKFYFFLIPALILFISAPRIREKIWESRKPAVKTPETFYAALTSTVILSMAILGAVGMGGLVIFILSGKLYLSLLFLAISAAGKFLVYPSSDFIENCKKDFPSLVT